MAQPDSVPTSTRLPITDATASPSTKLRSVSTERIDRRYFIGGSDARIIMGNDESALIRLWREKRGEVEPRDLSTNLAVQLGVATQQRALGRKVSDEFTVPNNPRSRRLRNPDQLRRRERYRQNSSIKGVPFGCRSGGPFQRRLTHMNPLVLVVDDEPDVEILFRQQFRRYLRADRFTMEFAQSAS